MAGQAFRYPSSASLTIAAIGANGAAIPTSSILIAGENPSGNLAPLNTDSAGNLIVSPLSSSSIVTANQGSAAVLASAWPVKLTDGTNVNSFTANGLKVDGSAVTQPVSAASLPLPTGASTSALQTTGNTSLASIATNTANIPTVGQKTSSASLPVVLASDQSPLPVASSAGRPAVTHVRNAYSSTNVTTSAYVQLVASTSATVNQIFIFDSSGQTLVLATGGSGSEVDQILIVPGGNGIVPLAIASGTRVSIKAVSATANVGEIDINFFG